MVKASAGRESMRPQLCTPSAPSLHTHMRTGYFFFGFFMCGLFFFCFFVFLFLSVQGPSCSIFYWCHMVSLVASRKLLSYSMRDLVPYACSVTKSCPPFCDPMDCGPPGSSVHEIFQARILEWVAISFSKGSS